MAATKLMQEKAKEVESFAKKRGLKGALPWLEIITAIFALLGDCGFSADEAAEHIRMQANDEPYLGWRIERLMFRREIRKRAPHDAEGVEEVLYDCFDQTTASEVKGWSPEMA